MRCTARSCTFSFLRCAMGYPSHGNPNAMGIQIPVNDIYDHVLYDHSEMVVDAFDDVKSVKLVFVWHRSEGNMIPPSHMTYVYIRHASILSILDSKRISKWVDPSFQPGFLGEYLILFDILGIWGIPPMSWIGVPPAKHWGNKQTGCGWVKGLGHGALAAIRNRLDSEVEVIRIAGYSCMILTSCLMGKLWTHYFDDLIKHPVWRRILLASCFGKLPGASFECILET